MKSFHPGEVCSGQTCLKAVELDVGVILENASNEIQTTEMNETLPQESCCILRTTGANRGKKREMRSVAESDSL
jgi:hypothetical protein